jgi:hypothetical protein
MNIRTDIPILTFNNSRSNWVTDMHTSDMATRWQS